MISTRRHGPIAVVTIDRPDALNSLDPSAMVDLRDALAEVRDDDSVRIGIVTGTGDRAFCTGADLKNTSPPSSSFAEGYFARDEAAVDHGLYPRSIALGEMDLRKPMIAAVNGHCLGGGFEMALACDLRVAAESATFGLTEPRWATVPAIGGISRLLRAVPSALAMRMLLTGERIDAAEAHRIGLVSDLVPVGGALSRALELAEQIAANGPLAVRAVHEMARRSSNLPLDQSVAIEQLLWGVLRDTADRAEGRDAFGAKRPPRYEGR